MTIPSDFAQMSAGAVSSLPETDVLLSVVVPTCNRPELLSRCLASLKSAVRCLPIGRCEVIVTIDHTRGEQLPEDTEIFRYVRGPDRGPAANRNCGVSRASGKWVIFIDDDCVPEVDILAAYNRAIEPGIFIYEGKTTCVGGLKRALDHAPVNLSGGYLWSCNFMISRAVFNQIGGFDEGFPYAAMEDVDLRERVKDARYTIRFVPEAVVDHPPRKLHGLEELERHYISMAYYTIRKRGEKLSARRLLSAALRMRLRRILTASDRTDSFRALRLLMRELWMIVRHTRRWERTFQT